MTVVDVDGHYVETFVVKNLFIYFGSGIKGFVVLSTSVVIGSYHRHPLNNKSRVIIFFNVLNSYFVYIILKLDMHLSF